MVVAERLILADNGTPRYSIFESGVEDFVDFFNQNVSGNSISTVTYGGIDTSIGDFGSSKEEEKAYLEAVANEIHDSIQIGSSDVIMTTDNVFKWGWGRKYDAEVNTQYGLFTVPCGRVFSNFGPAGWNVHRMTLHELGHCYGAHHDDGYLSLSGNDEYRDMTPMVTSYCKDQNVGCDLGRGDVGDTFFCADSTIRGTVAGVDPNANTVDTTTVTSTEHLTSFYQNATNKFQNWADSH